MLSNNVFAVPVLDWFLVYAPLHGLSALVNRQTLQSLRQSLTSDAVPPPPLLQPLLTQLTTTPSTLPSVRVGPVKQPLFLGLIPTRGCNMGCRYCDFAAPKRNSSVMSLSLARATVDAYFALLQRQGERRAEIHFFGGEPFLADQVIHFVVNYATALAAANQLPVHFEATSNGLYSLNRCHWIADHFQTLVLSLDGPADIQNYQRPGLYGHEVFNTIARNAKILSAGSVDLIIRACVTAQTVDRLPEIARWISQEFQPSAVCLESLIPSPLALSARMAPPDPRQFVRQFIAAADILEPLGIQTILSTADISTSRITFCPVGQDALIVTPEGQINGCYLLEADWQRQGLDLRLGAVEAQTGQFVFDEAAVERARALNVEQKPLCAHCLCRYHCAGGCHVNHATDKAPGHYDDLCVQTRLITIASLLRRLNQASHLAAWLSDDQAVADTVWQMSDCLVAERIST